ncbi:MAG TPA: hypothetical protein VMJ65_09240 [Solirubrobacteraceae bacterium]|nr:hypothetical protein [Solirubrobacteraceae bacterium]
MISATASAMWIQEHHCVPGVTGAPSPRPNARAISWMPRRPAPARLGAQQDDPRAEGFGLECASFELERVTAERPDVGS